MQIPCDPVNIKIGLIAVPTDTILIRQFESSTSFSSVIDSVLITDTSNFKKFGDTIIIDYSFNQKHGLTDCPFGLSSIYDYEVKFSENQNAIRISEINEVYEKNTAGFPNFDPHKVNYITSYRVNDKIYSGRFEELTIFIKK